MFIKSTFLLFMIIFFSYDCSNKLDYKNNNKQYSSENWSKVKVGNLSFSIPNDMSKEDIDGIDNLFTRYSNDVMSISVEFGANSEKLKQFEDVYYTKNFVKKSFTTQNTKGIQADFEFIEGETNYLDRNKRFAKVVSFDCEYVTDSVTISILFTHHKDIDIAEKIVKSISFGCN